MRSALERFVIGSVLFLMIASTAPRASAASDAAWLPPMDVLYRDRVQAESAQYLSVRLFNASIEPKTLADPASFVIESADDPDYAPAKAIQPAASGSRTRSVRVALRKDMLVKETAVFLKLPAPMKNGKRYAVKAAGAALKLPALAEITFDDTRQTNDNLRVNQLGYVPGMAKQAYLGQYGGDLGAIPFDAATFELLDRTGASVFSAAIKQRGVRDDIVGQTVYELDFTAFNTPGTYQIRVAGVGLSYPFVIGKEALNPGFVNLMRGNFHQRCGQAIGADVSRHVRGACHLDDAFLQQRVEKLKFVAPKKPPLYPTNYDEAMHPATHGHHDAGDYGKYTITGAGYVFSILLASEVFPDRYAVDNLGLPHSGNGIPDVLDECKWEIDWLENMQDIDGGVFGVIKPNTGGYEHMMPPATAQRLFYPKDTVFTAAFAGALAHAARSPVMRKHFPEDCDRYLAKALKAWEFLEKNERYVQYFHYGAIFGDWDERCWAAAELYAATGEPRFHDYFLKNFRPDEKRWGWWGLFESVGNAVTAYVFAEGRDKDAAMLAKCRAALTEACEAHVADSAAHPYRFSMPAASARSNTYGWYFPGDLAGWNLLLGYAMTNDDRYLQCAADNIGYSFGANPFGFFLHTGLGAKRNIEVVSDVANTDDIIEPVPGLPLGIGSPGFYWLNQYGKKSGEGTHPAEWPLMNRWYDGFNVTSEFTMTPMIRETLVTGFFADMKGVANARPTVKIKADRLSGAAPLTVQFDIETSLPADGVRQIFWDFGDETFSTQRSPKHVFSAAGMEYPVGVSIIDANGMWAYATTTVHGALDKVSFKQAEHAADEQTLMLFHLNGDLNDSSSSGLHLTRQPGPTERAAMRFSDSPPRWMAEPAGQCLVMSGGEQLTVQLPPAVIERAKDKPLRIEMLIYHRQFAGWAYPGNPVLLGFRGRSMFGLRQETWDKSGAPKFGKAIPPEKFKTEFPTDRWCQVVIDFDGRGKSTLLIDGVEWGSADGQPFEAADRQPVSFQVGPFIGMIDEVRVSTPRP